MRGKRKKENNSLFAHTHTHTHSHNFRFFFQLLNKIKSFFPPYLSFPGVRLGIDFLAHRQVLKQPVHSNHSAMATQRCWLLRRNFALIVECVVTRHGFAVDTGA